MEWNNVWGQFKTQLTNMFNTCVKKNGDVLSGNLYMNSNEGGNKLVTKDYVDSAVKIVEYDGNGSAERYIDIGFLPKFVILIGGSVLNCCKTSELSYTAYCYASNSVGSIRSKTHTCTNTGFKVGNENGNHDGTIHTNTENNHYIAICWR